MHYKYANKQSIQMRQNETFFQSKASDMWHVLVTQVFNSITSYDNKLLVFFILL